MRIPGSIRSASRAVAGCLLAVAVVTGCLTAPAAAQGTDSDTTAPTVPTGLVTQVVSATQINLSWGASSDDVAVAGYRVYRDGALRTESAVTQVQDAALTPASAYRYAVSAFDAAGNESAQTAEVVAVTPAADGTPPAVVMTAPGPGSTVSATVTVAADASDDVAVADVDFLLDGASIGLDDTAPYSVQWDTTASPDGVHSLSARARDAAGNVAVAGQPVSVTVANTPPSSLPAGLRAGWNFDDGAGTTAADVTGNGNTATLHSGPQWAAGRYGGGLELDGASDYLSIPNSPTIDIAGGALTVSAWVKPGGGGGDQVFLGKFYHDTMSSPYYQYGLELAAGAWPVLYIGTPAGYLDAGMGTNLPVGEWSHLAVVVGGGQARFYLNGELAGSPALPAAITARPAPLYLGADIRPSQHFRGAMDDVRIYDRALTGAEVQTDLSTPLGGSVAPAVAITSPAADAQVGGTVTISAVAAGSATVTGVQFLVDGQQVGAQDTTAPYEVSWDTAATANGAHLLTARATDASGGTSVSNPVRVTVVNGDYFQNEILATGLQLPTAMRFLPDGRMLVSELQGRIRVLAPPYTTAAADPFLVIADIGSSGVQQGIYDFALDPDFPTNHYFYVFYTPALPSYDRLSRFTADAGLTGTVPGSELVLYQDTRTADAEHHGGGIAFANDGTILFTTGDHFDPGTAQDLSSPRGKVHRINRDGTVPTDNPFYDGAGPHWDSVWAYGLRNPLRAYYDGPTGRLFIGDVGGNVGTSREEVNLGAPGADYGWPNHEGPCPPPCTGPVHYYDHNNRDAAVMGGFVYHGDQFPAAMRGSYFFADYAQNWIKRLTLDGAGNVTGVYNVEPASGELDGPTGDVVYLTEGPDGALYYLDLGYSDVSGSFGVSKIRRIRYLQSDQAPTAVATASVPSGPLPLQVDFSSAGSNDPEGQPLTYWWDFGDGATSTEADPTHTYTAAGQYTVRLTVSDSTQSTLSAPVSISAGSAPSGAITGALDGQTFRAGQVISYGGQAEDAEDGVLPASAFRWNVDFLHDGHVHPVEVLTGVPGGSLVIPGEGHDFSGNTRYRITLTVTDSHGLTGTRTVTVWPEKVDLPFDTVPSGLVLYLDGIAKTTPFVHDSLIGFRHDVEARDQPGGVFASWSDGGAQRHVITVPPTPSSYLATFTAPPPPGDGPAAAWDFDEGSGASAADSSGNGNTATLRNNPAWVAGKHGTGLRLDGVDDYLSLANSPSLDIAGPAFSLAMWLNPQSVSGDRAVIGKFWNAGMTSPYYQYGMELSGGNPHFYLGTPSGYQVVDMGRLLPVDQWSHVGIVFNGSGVQFYLNGTLVSTKSLNATLTARGNAMNLGADATPAQFFQGTLDGVRLYGRALSAAELQATM